MSITWNYKIHGYSSGGDGEIIKGRMKENSQGAHNEIGTMGILQWNDSFSVQECCGSIPEGMRKCDFELRIVNTVQEIRLWNNVASILQRKEWVLDLQMQMLILHSTCLDSPFPSSVAICL